MQDRNWEQKIRYFSKFLGFDGLQTDDPFVTYHRNTIQRRQSMKGIQITKNPFLSQSTVGSIDKSYEDEKKWSFFLRTPFNYHTKKDLLRLIKESKASMPKKVLPWLASNRQKMNAKLFNLKRQQYRRNLNQNQKEGLTGLRNDLKSEVIGTFLLSREDMIYSDTIQKIAGTLFIYTPDSPVVVYSLLGFICSSEVYLGITTKNLELYNEVIQTICFNVFQNCTSTIFLKKNQIKLDYFIRMWIQSFWLCIEESGTKLQEKILYFLLINQMKLSSVSKICEAIIYSLSRLLNQGMKQKILYTLTHPKIFLDQDMFIDYLFSE